MITDNLLIEGPGRPMDPAKKRQVDLLRLQHVYGDIWKQLGTEQRFLWIRDKSRFDPIETRGRGRPKGSTSTIKKEKPKSTFRKLEPTDDELKPDVIDVPQFNVGNIPPDTILTHTPAGSNMNFLMDAQKFLSNPDASSARNLIQKYDILVKDNGALRAGKKSGLKETDRYLLGKMPTKQAIAFMEFLKKKAGGLNRDVSQIKKAEPSLAPKTVFMSAQIQNAEIDEIDENKLELKIGDTLKIKVNRKLVSIDSDIRNSIEWKEMYAQAIKIEKAKGTTNLSGPAVLFKAKRYADRKIQMMSNTAKLITSISEMRNKDTGKFNGKVISGGRAAVVMMKSDIKAAIAKLKDLRPDDKEEIQRDIEKLASISGVSNKDTLEQWNRHYIPIQEKWEQMKNFNKYIVGFCESISAILCKQLGASAVIIPDNPTTKLGDIIAIYESRPEEHGVKGLDVVVDFVSVKKDGGGAGSALPRIELSAFDTVKMSDGRNVDGIQVKNKILELLDQGNNGVFSRLFYSDDPESALDYAEVELGDLWNNYDDLIFNYVGLTYDQRQALLKNKTARQSLINDIRTCWRNGRHFSIENECSDSDAISLLRDGCASKTPIAKKAHRHYFEYARIIEALTNKLTVSQAWSTHVHKSKVGVKVSDGGYDSEGSGLATLTGTTFMPDKKSRPNSARNDGSCVPSTQFPMKSDIVQTKIEE